MRPSKSAAVCLAVSVGAILVACGSPGPEADGVGATEEELSARAPIPYVLQFVGEYDAAGGERIEWLALRRTGTFAARIDGQVVTGKFYGPQRPASPLTLTFVSKRLTFAAVVKEGYDTQPPHPRLDVTLGKSVETVTAPWPSGGETMCDDTGGAWADDDADPATGLFCGCPGREVYIPSKGGCVR